MNLKIPLKRQNANYCWLYMHKLPRNLIGFPSAKKYFLKNTCRSVLGTASIILVSFWYFSLRAINPYPETCVSTRHLPEWNSKSCKSLTPIDGKRQMGKKPNPNLRAFGRKADSSQTWNQSLRPDHGQSIQIWRSKRAGHIWANKELCTLQTFMSLGLGNLGQISSWSLLLWHNYSWKY